MKRALFAVALSFLAATPVLAQSPWIHVAVDDAGDDATKVNVNLPLSVVRVALQAAPESIFSEGKLRLSHVDKDLDVESLRRVWAELRETGDAELVSVIEDDESIRIRRAGDLILIDIDERNGEDPERVRIEVPMRVVDALFSGEGETLDIYRAFAELSKERGDIVNVDDGETKVRVWIDEKD